MANQLPVIFGLSGTALTQGEADFFAKAKPVGFILFARNCVDPKQVKGLVADLKSVASGPKTMMLIDQEGGRVARLKPPHWPAFPTAESLALGENAEQEVYDNARRIADILEPLGINVNCAPLADLHFEGAHHVIGDRAFGADPEWVSTLARRMADGLADGGVVPVLKHIPGHGRALVDSHEELPVVTASLETLRASDFIPFKRLNDLPIAMTAHIRYDAIDPALPATLSPKVIRLIREELGFEGLLLSDDVSMKALKGDIGQISASALQAGCDVVLHCNGQMEEMQRIVDELEEMALLS